ncbi:hypothetical protein C8Q77DRAFT_1108321 [Trametes polyzona]|nr:hypothetical protein C8Q77DRAFT_1108321 [Trametes polyzona]
MSTNVPGIARCDKVRQIPVNKHNILIGDGLTFRSRPCNISRRMCASRSFILHLFNCGVHPPSRRRRTVDSKHAAGRPHVTRRLHRHRPHERTDAPATTSGGGESSFQYQHESTSAPRRTQIPARQQMKMPPPVHIVCTLSHARVHPARGRFARTNPCGRHHPASDANPTGDALARHGYVAPKEGTGCTRSGVDELATETDSSSLRTSSRASVCTDDGERAYHDGRRP